MKSKAAFIFAVGLGAVVVCAVLGRSASAQPEQTRINISPDGNVDLKDIPRMGEDVLGSLMASRVDQNPLESHFGNTRVCLVPGLWECHTWYNQDGTGIEFHVRRKPDNSLELASTEFTYRVTGKQGDYHLCRTPEGGAETCAKSKWNPGHYLYDEWFINYDRSSQGAYGAYKNVHEQYAVIPGHR